MRLNAILFLLFIAALLLLVGCGKKAGTSEPSTPEEQQASGGEEAGINDDVSGPNAEGIDEGEFGNNEDMNPNGLEEETP